MVSVKHQFNGKHAFGELYGIDYLALNDNAYLQELLLKGIKLSEANCEDIISKCFEPQGVSIIALLSESHTSIHTYPEEGALFIDAFTCGNHCNPMEIINLFIRELNPCKKNITLIKRG